MNLYCVWWMLLRVGTLSSQLTRSLSWYNTDMCGQPAVESIENTCTLLNYAARLNSKKKFNFKNYQYPRINWDANFNFFFSLNLIPYHYTPRLTVHCLVYTSRCGENLKPQILFFLGMKKPLAEDARDFKDIINPLDCEMLLGAVQPG